MTLDGRGLRVGIIGGGFMGRVHAHAARVAGAAVIAAAGSTEERGRQAAATVGAERAAAAESLIAARDIDVVHVCTPNSTHARYALMALESGKHVICEKPIAVAVADAEAVAAAASMRGLVVAVPFVYRFHPLVREIRDRLAGAPISTFHARYLQDWLVGDHQWNWRVDEAAGGASRAFADIGSHLVDLLEFVTGDRIADVSARMATAYPVRAGRPVSTEDTVAAVVALQKGAIGTLLVSQVAPGHKNGLAIELSTDTETYRFDQENPDSIWIGRTTGSQLLPRGGADATPDAARLSRLPAGHPQGYQDAFNAFVGDAYATMREDDSRLGLPTVQDGIRALALTETFMRSAKQVAPSPGA